MKGILTLPYSTEFLDIVAISHSEPFIWSLALPPWRLGVHSGGAYTDIDIALCRQATGYGRCLDLINRNHLKVPNELLAKLTTHRLHRCQVPIPRG